jgi:hypothetical protein
MGSISKFVQSSNQYDVDTHDIVIAINELSTLFDVDMRKAVVKRLDYAENLIMDHEVGKYIEILSAGTTGKSFRISDETFYVEKHQKTILAYNKIKELKKDKAFLHPDLIGKHVLRFEARWFEDVPKLLSMPTLTFGMLVEHRVVDKIKQLWADEVLGLNFRHSYASDFDYSTTKAIESSYASLGIQADGGFDVALQKLNRQKQLTAQQKYRLANKLKEINCVNAAETTKTLAEEIIEKVKIAVETPRTLNRMLPYTI